MNGPARASAFGADIALGGANEQTIVVNPIEPLNLAMSSLHQYRVSNDGGASWGPARFSVVPSDYTRSGDPSLAFDSQGRLFYAHLGTRMTGGGVDAFVTELDPASGDVLFGPVRVTNAGPTTLNDKPWLAADPFPDSPFHDRLYLVWTEFMGNRTVFETYSVDHGATWSAPTQLSDSADFLPWPAHVAVAPNGDVYVSYHAQTGFMCNTDGVSGKVFVARSTDGGASFAQKALALGPGQADISFNVQDCPDGVIPGTDFWMQGSAQAWLLPDPFEANIISVVANDDPDDVHGSGDDGNVYIVRSDDYGITWADPQRIDHDPGVSLQAFPTAAIDLVTGCIVVMWYDTRIGALNANGNYLLDVFYSISTDGGLSFGPDTQLNDAPFDPDKDAPTRFAGPPPTRRIGEYIGAAFGASTFHGVWTGNNVSSQQAITDSVAVHCEPEPPPPPIADPSGESRNRFVSFFVPPPVQGAPLPTALRIRLVDLQNPNPPNAPCCAPPDYSSFEAATCTAAGETNDCVRWVGPPQTFLESQDNPGFGSFTAARLQCTPHYHDWSIEGLIHVAGAEIVPSSRYEAAALSASCKGNEDACTMVSDEVTMTTRRWGDVVTPFNPPATTQQPDGSDVVQLVNKFKNLPDALSKPIGQLQPNLPELNGDVGGADIVQCVDALKQYAYPFGGPCPCPSQAACGVLVCPSGATECTNSALPGLGAGATCVKTCISGDNDGDPCINNSHCPGGGTCGNPFCRDRCGRCN